MTARDRLAEVLGSPLLCARLDTVASPFLERRADDESLRRMAPATLRGVARALVANAESARMLAARPRLLEDLADAGDARAVLEERERSLVAHAEPPEDLEDALDEMRILRREETLFAACLHLADVVPFAAVSRFLSTLAETILERSLVLAGRGGGAGQSIAVIGMGKIGGREFTYGSDLDLLFLFDGDADDVARVSRIGQRLVAYLTTMTRAGVAYAVDTRLRPSGNQGLLVTSYEAYEAYQRDQAQLWEHLVLMRARAVAGDRQRAAVRIASVREAVLRSCRRPWAGVAEMRARVERERGDESDGTLAWKTGPGGMMDVDFLASAAFLERGARALPPREPSNAGMLRAVAPEHGIAPVLAAYDVLREVEARARFVAGRAIEAFEPRSEGLGLTAAFFGLSTEAELRERIDVARRTIRAAFTRVAGAGTITALG